MAKLTEEQIKAAEARKFSIVKDLVDYNVGTEDFLNGLEIVNLESMLTAIQIREGEIIEKNGEIKKLKAVKPGSPKKDPKITTVADLQKAGSIQTAGKPEVKAAPKTEPKEEV